MSGSVSQLPNGRLRERIRQAGLSIAKLAELTGIDQRTIQRWLVEGTKPQAANARAIADALHTTASDLWPEAYPLPTPVNAGVIPARVFASRAHMPVQLWQETFTTATEQLDFCVYGGTFLFDNVPGFLHIIRDAAARGVRVRFIAGDPASAGVHQRGIEEGIGDALAARSRMTLTHLEKLHDVEGVRIRAHGTPLYVSMFRADDTLYANHHILGSPAGDNPVIEFTRSANPDLWEKYQTSFEIIWRTAKKVHYPLPVY